MNRDKQIEEMAETMCAFYGTEMCYECRYCCDCHINKEAERIYNAGYRKASELAKEIFEEIEKLIVRRMIPDVTLIDDRLITDIAELKKKYTEEGK